MSAYAIYRLPHEDHATLITQSVGEPMELHSLTELNGKQGFVVAPFEVKADQPVVLIQGKTETIALSNEQLTADDGKNYNYKFYSLAAIIAVGYRTNSDKATQFLQRGK